MFPLTDTENNSNKPKGSNKVLMHQDQSQIRGKILIWAVKSCSAFWANSPSHLCFLQLCWPVSYLQGLLSVFCSPDNGPTHTGTSLRKDRYLPSWNDRKMQDVCKSNSRLCPHAILLQGRCLGLLFLKSVKATPKGGGSVTVLCSLSHHCYWLIAHCTLLSWTCGCFSKLCGGWEQNSVIENHNL